MISDKLEQELEEMRLGNAKVIVALDTAIQLVEALLDERLRYLPEGSVLNGTVDACKSRLDEALKDLRR